MIDYTVLYNLLWCHKGDHKTLTDNNCIHFDDISVDHVCEVFFLIVIVVVVTLCCY